jgi:hypothetical protein
MSYTLGPFGVFYGHLVYVLAIWYNLQLFGIFFMFWYAAPKKNLETLALTAWRSGHTICLRNRRPGFESRKGVSFLGKHSNAVVFQ